MYPAFPLPNYFHRGWASKFCNQITRIKLSCWLVGISTSYFRHKGCNQKGRTMVHSHQVQFQAIWSSQGYYKAINIFGEVHGKFLSCACAVHASGAWVSFNTPLLHHELVFGLFDGHIWTRSLKNRKTWSVDVVYLDFWKWFISG